jgi:hypothetical protein
MTEFGIVDRLEKADRGANPEMLRGLSLAGA